MKNTIRLTESDIKYIVNKAIYECYKQNGTIEEGKLGKVLGAAALGGALMFGNPTNANAQLNIKSQTTMEPQKICSLSPQIQLYREDDGYRIRLTACGLERSERAQRQFNRGGTALTNTIAGIALQQAEKAMGNSYLSLFLGVNEESATKTLKELIDLVNSQIHQTEVSQNDGDVVLTNNTNKMYPKGLWIEQEGVEGYNILPLNTIEAALKNFRGNTYQVNSDYMSQQPQESIENEEEFLEYRKLKALIRGAQEDIKNSNDPALINIKKEMIKKVKKKMKEIESYYAEKGYQIQ